MRHQIDYLKSQIILKSKNDRIRTILFSSYSHGEGTTTIVSHFVESLIQDKQYKVLLVDANTRSLGSYGLQHFEKYACNLVFQDLFDSEEKSFNLQRPDYTSNIVFIPCTQTSIHPSEIFHHEKFANFLKYAKNYFDFSIFDSCPIGTYYDATVISSYIDSMILVVESERRKYSEIKRTKNFLKERNIPLNGVVFNRRKFRIPSVIYNKLFK